MIANLLEAFLGFTADLAQSYFGKSKWKHDGGDNRAPKGGLNEGATKEEATVIDRRYN